MRLIGLVQCIVDIQSGFLLILQGANKTVEAGST
jgi:hypothetical protein